jgi:hypothetical protein
MGLMYKAHSPQRLRAHREFAEKIRRKVSQLLLPPLFFASFTQFLLFPLRILCVLRASAVNGPYELVFLREMKLSWPLNISKTEPRS